MFGRGNGKQEPVPKGVQLMGNGQESQEIKLSKLTEEILKEDIGFIRSFYQRLTEVLNEKLSLLDAVSNSQQENDRLLKKVGISHDQLISANVAVLAELRKFVVDQGSSNAQVVKTLVGVIESLNQVIEAQNLIIAKLGDPTAEMTETKIETIRLAEPTQAASDVQAETASERSAGDLKEDLDENFLSENASTETEGDSTDNQFEQPTDPIQFAGQMLEGIRNNIFTFFGSETEIQSRPAEDIPGIQFNDIWILALPPKTDGKYDNSVMQDTAFKKIKALMSKNKKETVIAVYLGEISEKKLVGAKRVADDFKIVLTNFSEIKKVLAQSSDVETPAV